MTTRTYTGTCQCGRVRYEAVINFGTVGAQRLMLSENPTALIKPRAFRLLSGAADLEDFQFGTLGGHNQACRHCGIRPFGRGRLPALGGDFYAINLATLDQPAPLTNEAPSQSESASSFASSPR
jgi:hypothetical protein